MPEPQEIIAALLQQRTSVVFRAGGPSMNPAIRDGDTVSIRPPADTPPPGSVVLCQLHGRLVLHRRVRGGKRTGRYYTVGDAAVEGGEWIAPEALLGVAEWVRHAGIARRLDTRRARWAGLLRYALRPLRRAIWNFRQTHHAQTPARWNS